MGNWEPIEDNKRTQIWDFIYDTLLFHPHNDDETKIIQLPIPTVSYDLSHYYNDNIDLIEFENVYDDLHNKVIACFKELTHGERAYAFDWQHTCYIFSPELPFEKDEFDEWLIPLFPNAEYVFFFTKDLKNGIFVDGFLVRISLFGEEMINDFDSDIPKAFGKKCNS